MKTTHPPVHAPTHARTLHCPNCAAHAPGKFCPACGESTVVHSASAFEFIHEFVGHYVALEGKLWKTLLLLLFRPGQLTVDYLQGKRVRYINPLRLYLTLSLIVFALIKLYGVELPKVAFDARSFGVEYSHTVTIPVPPDQPKTATVAITARDNEGQLTPLENAMARLGAVNTAWKRNVQAFMDEAPARKAAILNQGFLANLPYMLIGALPLFALYLKVIYLRSRRYYGEHLVFALHANAFAFLLASLMIIVPGNVAWLGLCLYKGWLELASSWDWLQLLPFVWLVAYLPAAMQRVYGGSRWATAARWLVLMTVHLMVLSLLVVGAELIGIVKYSH